MVNAFQEGHLSEFLRSRLQAAIKSISLETENYISSVDEDQYITHVCEQTRVEPLELMEQDIYVSEKVIPVSGKSFPSTFMVNPDRYYDKNAAVWHVPFQGDGNLLRYAPSSFKMWTEEIEIFNDEFTFVTLSLRDDSEEIKREKDKKLDYIRGELVRVLQDVRAFNSRIRDSVEREFRLVKQKFTKKNNLISSLGVPVKKARNSSKTINIPNPKIQKKIISSKPPGEIITGKPEPTLSKECYLNILENIHKAGREFERHSDSFSGMGEEQLRDFIITVLSPPSDGSAFAETFNKSGKTDILIRHEGENVFIAECKFWKGPKSLLNTVDQLLGYLTWRDSKAALIFFVPNKEMSAVLNSARTEICKHPCFSSEKQRNDESWMNYLFHFEGDKERKVHLAVMLYHLPR